MSHTQAGSASGNIDISEKLANALPGYLGLVIGISLIIMILVFRSILVPVTATLGFILSLFATFGGVTAIFQWGWLGAVFGIHDPGPVLSFLPTILIGILFGLAMDYQLFLVSGMREAYAHGAPARLAVQQGRDVAVFQPGHDPPLPAKAAQQSRIAPASGHGLDGHPFLIVVINPMGLEHRPHAALADFPNDVVGTEPAPGGKASDAGALRPGQKIDLGGFEPVGVGAIGSEQALDLAP